ncbi:flippase domain-containing glycosyltransferase AglD [Haloferax sp. MBLA0076]|uniref:Flippase domain-containing glycosyltransferase AglD n=1 Tax=Haloferax litoreum TaxID=2666140 RepID=A0A6A8GBW8_9EURY|nr:MULTISPECIES: flippase domain-containing glycosyltransferase AglD [Haloferax]KAB1192159.1 flippase domain-containing glycosyltransferase AglD [Haloferax sp. CBA1148]MRX20608.1 flippase domain-containing glycosyltransferase AglD [Haloferax litoreum]
MGRPTDRRSVTASSAGVEVSVVLPAYNEERTIENTVTVTVETLESFLPNDAFEVIVAEDGCDDRTPEIATRMASEDERIRHYHSDERLGRGGALERAFDAAHGETLVYFDTDLATDMRHLEELVERVRSGEYDVATGSRWMPEHVANRPVKRGFPSQVYNGLVRFFLRSNLRDHQCGFKAFSRTAFETLRDDVEDNHWFWDTEMLVRAQRAGLRVAEFPVDWEPKGDTKVDLVRDILGMGSQIMRTWWQLSVRPRITQRVTIAAGLLLTVVAVALMTLYIDPSEVLSVLGEANPALVAAAAGIYVLSWPLRGVRYRDILRELGYYEKASFLTGAIFISQTGNLVFPARAGDAVRAYVVKARRGIPYPSGFASLAVERVFDLLTIAGLAGAVLVGLAATGGLADIATVLATGVSGGSVDVSADDVRTVAYVATGVGLVAIAGVIGIALSARADRNFVRAFVGRFSSDSYVEYVVDIIEQFVSDLQAVAGNRTAFSLVGLSSLAVWTIDVVTAIVVLYALGVDIDPVVLVGVSFFAVSVGNLAKVLPLSPGGVGLYEIAFTVFMAALAPVAPATALAAAVLDHAVKNAVTLVGGVVSMLSLNVSLTTAVEESADVREREFVESE